MKTATSKKAPKLLKVIEMNPNKTGLGKARHKETNSFETVLGILSRIRAKHKQDGRSVEVFVCFKGVK